MGIALAVAISVAPPAHLLLRGHSTEWNLAHQRHVWRLHSPFSRAPTSHAGARLAHLRQRPSAFATSLHPRVEPVDIADLLHLGPLALRRGIYDVARGLPPHTYPLMIFRCLHLQRPEFDPFTPSSFFTRSCACVRTIHPRLTYKLVAVLDDSILTLADSLTHSQLHSYADLADLSDATICMLTGAATPDELPPERQPVLLFVPRVCAAAIIEVR